MRGGALVEYVDRGSIGVCLIECALIGWVASAIVYLPDSGVNSSRAGVDALVGIVCRVLVLQ